MSGHIFINNKILDQATKAAEWLINIQEPNGNFPLIIDSSNGRQEEGYDLVRSALSGKSLATLGKVTGDERFIDAARRNFNFINDSLEEEMDATRHKELFLSYLGQLALSIGNNKTAIECAEKIASLGNAGGLDFISTQQTLVFFCELSEIDDRFSNLITDLSINLKGYFEEMISHNHPQPGLYAEIIHIFPQVYNLTKNEEFWRISKWLSNWFIKNQQENGVYRMSLYDNLPNTRKTGKVIEVLASFIFHDNLDEAEKKSYQKSLEKGASWIMTMQFDENNVNSQSPEIRKRIMGGIKHTPFDSRLWIDSAAHLIVSAARLHIHEKS